MMKPALLPSSSLLQSSSPIGCDTFVAFPPAAPAGCVIFGKNSDRPAGEVQSIRRYPGQEYDLSLSPVVRCTYISIPQSSKTYGVLLSQLDWMYGAEMGTNECGVVIGNEAVWTNADYEPPNSALVGMDLVRLGLERGATAQQAMECITSLLETFGQSGPCAQDDPDFDYHNSFLLVDSTEAWVLETAGRHWVTKRHTYGVCNISNNLTIRNDYDRSSSKGLLKEHARQQGLILLKHQHGHDPTTTSKLDFAKIFSVGSAEHSKDSRQVQGRKLLDQHADKGTLTLQAMMEILRDHDSGVCMHGGFETTASMVTEWRVHAHGSPLCRHWMTGKLHPCKSEFLEQKLFP
jgi:secernin